MYQAKWKRELRSVLRVISVDCLVLRRSSSIAAQLIRLFGIHAKNSGKCEQSWNNQSPQPGRHSPAHVPYAWKPVSHDNRAIIPSFLRALFRRCNEYLPFSRCSAVQGSYLSLAHGPTGMRRVKDCTSTQPASSSLDLSNSSVGTTRSEAIRASCMRFPNFMRGLSFFKEPSSLCAVARRELNENFRDEGMA
jgi:hypothetical protein